MTYVGSKTIENKEKTCIQAFDLGDYWTYATLTKAELTVVILTGLLYRAVMFYIAQYHSLNNDHHYITSEVFHVVVTHLSTNF